MANGMAEYVIKLSADLDNAGVKQILNYMDMTKLKALGLTAAITGISTAIYKFAESTAKKEYELQKLAKQQNKTTAAINAQQTALKSMGKTLGDINKDKALKTIYEDIRKFNAELELPNVDRAMTKVTNLRNAFWKMKSAMNMAVQAIGRQLLINLESPIERITGGLNDISLWVKNNLNNIISKVTPALTAFSKGVIGIGEGVSAVLRKVNELPDSLKKVGGAVAGIFALVEGGTLGRLLTLVGLIGDIYHDYDNYKWNIANQKSGEVIDPETGQPYQVPIGLGPIWEILEGEDIDENGKTKISRIAEKSIEILTTTFKDAWKNVNPLEDILGMSSGEGGDGIIAQITSWFQDEGNAKKFGDLGKAIVSFVSDTIRNVGDVAGWGIGSIANAIFGDGTVDESILTGKQGENASSAGAGLAAGLGVFVSGVLKSMSKPGTTLFKAFSENLGGSVLTSILTVIGGNITADENGINFNWSNTGADLVALGRTALGLVTSAIGAVKNVGSIIFTAIGGALKSEKDKGALSSVGKMIEGWGKEGSVLGGAISSGVAAWFGSGSLLGGIVGAIGSIFTDLANDPNGEKMKQLRADIKLFFNTLSKILVGEADESGKFSGGLVSVFTDLFGSIWSEVQPLLDPLWQGIRDGLTSLGADLWGIISPYIDLLFYRISVAFSETPLGQALTEAGILGTPGMGTYGVSETGTVSDVWGLEQAGYTETQIAEQLKRYGSNKAAQVYAKSRVFQETRGNLGYYTSKDGRLILPGDEYDINDIDYSKFSFPNMAREFVKLGDVGAMAKFVNIYDKLRSTVGNRSDKVKAYHEAREAVMNLYGETKNKVALQTELTPPTNGSEVTAAAQDSVGSVEIPAYITLAGVASGASAAGFGGAVSGALSGGGGSNRGKMTGTQEAWGGRIGRRMDGLTVGEDGTEYIIPITKPDRAIALLQQMFGEMGTSALNRVMTGLGLGQSGTNGASLSSLETAMSGMAMNSSYSVNAPTNIYVNSSGADAKEIGASIYDMAERHLIKNVMGVYS